jgi:hypothetical protein
MMSEFDPKVQERRDGPLTDDFRERILKVKLKHRLSYRAVAERAGLAGSTVGNVTRYIEGNISTTSATRLAEAVAKLEAAPVGAMVREHLREDLRSAPAPHRDPIADAISTLQSYGLGVILIAGSASVTVPVAVAQQPLLEV